MDDLERSEALDELVEAVLVGHRGSPAARDPELGALVEIARELRGLPREDFRAELREQLRSQAERSTTMTTVQHIPRGLGSVTPFLIVRDVAAALDLYEAVFGATDIQRDADPGGTVRHASLRIGSSMVEMGQHEDVELHDPSKDPQVGMHLYVEDVDALVERAAGHGLQVVRPVELQPYGDREATIADPFGIVWYVATHVSDA